MPTLKHVRILGSLRNEQGRVRSDRSRNSHLTAGYSPGETNTHLDYYYQDEQSTSIVYVCWLLLVVFFVVFLFCFVCLCVSACGLFGFSPK